MRVRRQAAVAARAGRCRRCGFLSRWARTEIARVGEEQVHVVGFVVELDEFDTELSANGAHGGLGCW